VANLGRRPRVRRDPKPKALKARFIIGLARFKTNIVDCCAGTVLISTSVMCGIEASQPDELRFQRLATGIEFPGAMPQAQMR